MATALKRSLREFNNFPQDQRKNYTCTLDPEDHLQWRVQMKFPVIEINEERRQGAFLAFYTFVAYASLSKHLFLPKEIVTTIGKYLFPLTYLHPSTLSLRFPPDYPFKPPNLYVEPSLNDPIGLRTLSDEYNRISLQTDTFHPTTTAYYYLDMVSKWVENHDNDLQVTGGHNGRCRKSTIQIFELIAEDYNEEVMAPEGEPIVHVTTSSTTNTNTTSSMPSTAVTPVTLRYRKVHSAVAPIFGCHYWLNHYKTVMLQLHAYNAQIVSEKRYAILECHRALNSQPSYYTNVTDRTEAAWKKNSCGCLLQVFILPTRTTVIEAIEGINVMERSYYRYFVRERS